MRFYLITNDEDTCVGMRLAGIEGEVVKTKAQALEAIAGAVQDEKTGIVMINSSLALSLAAELLEIKKNSGTLIVEIPDKGGTDKPGDSITRYVADAVGVKL